MTTLESTNRIVSESLNKTIDELQDVRGKLKVLSDKLNSAEEALRYYSNPKHYKCTVDSLRLNPVIQNVLQDDLEGVANPSDTKVAGRRAREYFKRYDNLPHS